MAANFLHGAETIEVTKGPVPVRTVKSSVIGIVGIAPKGPVNTPTVVLSDTDAAAFGAQLPGFSIPKALADIQKQGAGTIVVVNVFNESTHTTQVTDEPNVVTGGKFRTDFAPVNTVVLKSNDGLTTYIADTDYTINDFGDVVVLKSDVITEGSTVKATYKKLNAAAITSATIIGTVNTTTNARTGMKCFDLCFNQFGFTPKIFISPGYVTLNTVAVELLAVASKFRGSALIDAPIGTTPQGALTGRGPSGSINFNTSSDRAILCYPHLKAYDAYSDAEELRPYSQFLAGVMAATDNSDGYWVSPSNREIKGILGVETMLTFQVNDATTQANLLNEAGIVVVVSSFGTGFRTWGNRSAAFPSNTAPKNFINVRRTADIVHESLELAMLQFIDVRNITKATIDSIRQTVNLFFNTLISRDALIDGKCTFDPGKNPVTELAAGHLTFTLNFMPPTPAERITFESFIDIELLRALYK